jgi:hypothetical protein
MFTERMQRYVSYEDHLAMFFLEPDVEVPGRVIGQSGEEERVGFGDAARRASEAFPFRVLAYGHQYLPDGAFDPGCVYLVSLRVRPLRLFGASLCQLHGKGEWLVGCSSPVS